MEIEVSGNTVYAYTSGKAFKPEQATVVFIHGAAHDHSVWSLQSRWLACHGWNVLALDLPGHGRSTGSALTSIEALADWTLACLDQAGISQATLVGHSMGSLIALETAGRAPQRVDHLALIGCAFPMAVSENLLDAARDNTPLAIDMITGWSHAPASQLSGGALPGMWLPGINRALMNRAAAGVLHQDLLNCQRYARGLDAAAKLNCPTLLIIGERDLMTPRKAVQGLKEKIKNVREASIAGAGHAMMSERSDAVLDALRDFLR